MPAFPEHEAGAGGGGRRWMAQAAAWALSLLAAAAVLTASLRHRANPWRLALAIPSGQDEAAYRRYGGGSDERGGPADLAADGRRLALGRPSGRVEVWDLADLRRLAVLGDPVSNASGSPAGLANAADVRWLSDGQHVAVLRSPGGWEALGLDGSHRSIGDPRSFNRGAAAAPAGPPLLATADIMTAAVVDGVTGRTVHAWETAYTNGSRRRIDWSADARRLLLTDLLGVRVWDAADGRLLCFHRELNLTLPPPMIADDQSGIAGFERARERAASGPATAPAGVPPGLWAPTRGRTDFATLADARMAPDGSAFAVAYGPDGMSLAPGPAPTCRVRLYRLPDGGLAWDVPLPAEPRALAFSPDGSRLFVTLRDRPDRPCLAVVDAATGNGRLVGAGGGYSFPAEPVPFPDGRWVAARGEEVWAVDADARCAPVRLPTPTDGPAVAAVRVTPDGRTAVAVGLDTTARVFRLARPPSVLGAFALPETWGVYGGSAAAVVAAAMAAGRDAARRRGRRLQAALWAALFLGAAATGLTVGDRAVAWAVRGVYDRPDGPPPPLGSAGDWVLTLALLVTLLGTARLRRGWWIARLVSLGVLACLLALAGAAFAAATGGRPSADRAIVIRGWLASDGPTAVCLFIALFSAWVVAEGVLLLRRDVRDCFPRRVSVVLAEGQPGGFPLVDSRTAAAGETSAAAEPSGTGTSEMGAANSVAAGRPQASVAPAHADAPARGPAAEVQP